MKVLILLFILYVICSTAVIAYFYRKAKNEEGTIANGPINKPLHIVFLVDLILLLIFYFIFLKIR